MRRVVARSFANVLRLNLETFGAGEKVSEETMKNMLVAVNALLEQDHAMYDVLVVALVGSSFPFSVLVVVLHTLPHVLSNKTTDIANPLPFALRIPIRFSQRRASGG